VFLNILYKERIIMQLRDYQTQAIEDIRTSIKRGNKRVVLQASCGAGKTIVAAQIVKQAIAKDKKVVFLVHYRQLAHQAMERFTAYGMDDQVGYIMADEESHLERPVQIISVQTYSRRLNLKELEVNEWFAKADLVFYDECHSSIAKTRKAILDLYKDTAVIIGLTATPCRSDGRPLGAIYQDIVSCSNIKALTKAKFLVPVIYYGAKELPDLEKIPLVGGDYNKKILEKRVNKDKLVGDILENWLRIAPDRQTVIFATNVKHSRHIKETFEAAGINIEHIDARTPDDERAVILDNFNTGKVQIITNCNVFSEGADMPCASCIVDAKPTKSYLKFVQIVGRGLRPYLGKKDCIFIDHARVVEEHGFIDDPVDWTLNGKEKAFKKVKVEKKEKKPITCEQCQTMFRGAVCPRCGLKIKSYGKAIKTTDAELQRIKRKKDKTRKKTYTMEEKRHFYGQLKAQWLERKTYKRGWIAQQYKAKFGCWPKGMDNIAPEPPDKNFKNFLTWQRIKWATRKK